MKSRRYSLVRLNDWKHARDPYTGFTVANLCFDWLRGEWVTGEIALLGFGLTLTRWSRKPVPVENLGREHA